MTQQDQPASAETETEQLKRWSPPELEQIDISATALGTDAGGEGTFPTFAPS